MSAENLSLDFMKNRLFGDFLAQDGLTEISTPVNALVEGFITFK